jgi:hypothetical protein
VPVNRSLMSTRQNSTSPTYGISPSSIHGTYKLIFNLNYNEANSSKIIPWGNYTVEVLSSYQGNQAINSYIFWARIPGDANGDGRVNIKDMTPIQLNWLKTVPMAPASADLNGDGFINIKDAAFVQVYWLKAEYGF